MAKKSQARSAISKYLALCRKLEESRSEHPAADRIRDVGGAFIDRDTHEQIVQHLTRSLPLDEDDDAIRLLLAYEFWRAARSDEALREYEAIVRRDSMQSPVAQRMIGQIRASIP